jgi:cysteine desulfurase
MQPYWTERFGNPSSIHARGREARAAVDNARDAIAAAISSEYSELYFTSSGTEADNLAVAGVMLAAPSNRRHLIVSAVEHHAILHTAGHLQKVGFEVTTLPVDGEGLVDPHDLHSAMRDDTALVSIIHGSNEIGTIQDIHRLAIVAHERGALFHSDAVQSFGSLPINVRGLDCDLLSISAHKIYGPKGVGALYIRTGVKVSPILFGGTQEREKRAGTENTAGIVGFGKAVELMAGWREAESARLTALRDRFIDRSETIPGLRLNGPRKNRLPNNLNVSIEGVDGAAALMSLDRAGIAASSGSACSSGSIEPSHVLQAIGLPRSLAAGGIRFTLGKSTTGDDLESTVVVLGEIAARLRR